MLDFTIMVDTVETFIVKHRTKLLQIVRGFIDQTVSLSEAREHIWRIMDDWDLLPEVIRTQRYIKGEKAFWAIIWEINTISDEDYTEGEIQALNVFLECLAKMSNLPSGYEARRP